MSRDIAETASTVLVVVGVVALLGPALVPVQQVLYHEVGAGTTMNGSQLEAEGYTVVGYENLSERGQEIYVAALESPDREYTVPVGEGAPEFPYDGAVEADRREDYRTYQRLTGIVVERPDDADLPPPAEPVGRIDYQREQRDERPTSQNATESEADTQRQRALERREQAIGRYDLLTVRKGSPPLTDPANLVRLGAVAFGAVALGVGGYLRSRP
ncbi:hypothetical protein [Haloarcula onubensis]|uniref:DUF3592 domain-containing protein n=1 Tax=Haloarcula onubensis TaxID=2950539 RepID=A0ABU2FMC3_9EURY|nr:hypothetical protein [Halomicroarcula sp. S3CR25-11]MDS0281331.1 hypothetical protein [Halomicroarcula sp. S3CR25-11]